MQKAHLELNVLAFQEGDSATLGNTLMPYIWLLRRFEK